MTPQQKIEEYMRTLGLMTVGFCNAEPMVDYALFISNEHKNQSIYFDIGYNKSMEDTSWYTPRIHLPEAKSIITLLLPYHMKLHKGEPKPALAISKAALFKDYHLTMNEYLDQLKDFISATYNKKSIGYSDTGPLNDKAVLLQTGTVSILRNSLLFHKDYGSRFYIGYLITELDIDTESDIEPESDIALGSDIELESETRPDNDLIVTNQFNKVKFDKWLHPYCEKCGKCQYACPNGAIEKRGHLTSEKCISYLTQSKKWELNEETNLSGYIYGCDICQLVCPLNGGDLSAKYDYEPIIGEEVKLSEIEVLTNREFKSIYGPSSAGWIGKKRFIRNIKQNHKMIE